MRLCREKIRRARAHLELHLAAAVKDNIKCFYKYIRNRRRPKENLHPLLDAGGNTVTKGEEKTEVLHACFSSVIVRPVHLGVANTLSWKTGTGSRMKPP